MRVGTGNVCALSAIDETRAWNTNHQQHHHGLQACQHIIVQYSFASQPTQANNKSITLKICGLFTTHSF